MTSLIGPLTSTDDNQLLDRSAALARLPSKPRLVYLVAIVWAAAACVWSARTHSFFLYSDARTHLDIARHVTDGLTPGLAQLGSVWLPLPHLLLVPLVASTWMWHSGAAGAIVGGACFVYSAVRVYTLVDELTGNRVGAWCAFAIYATNLNLLYLQTAALTEPVLLAFFIGAIYHLARWMRTRSVRSLALAGLLTFGASLSRYEGWVLLFAAAGLVFVWSRLEPHQVKEPQANVLLYLVLGGYGIVLWIIYNAVIFHNPLYFIESSNSAQSQQHTLANAGQLSTKGHLLTSSLTYGWTVIDVVGPIVAGIGFLCVVLLCLRRYPGRRRILAVLFLLASPIVFNVVALWSGQSALRVPQVAPYGMFNDRYGIMALPILCRCYWSRRRPVAQNRPSSFRSGSSHLRTCGQRDSAHRSGRSQRTLERDTWTPRSCCCLSPRSVPRRRGLGRRFCCLSVHVRHRVGPEGFHHSRFSPVLPKCPEFSRFQGGLGRQHRT